MIKNDMPPLVWLDMEMTGLNPEEHVILEVAIILTDSDLNSLTEPFHRVIYQDSVELDKMDEWCLNCHQQNGLLKKVQESSFSIVDVENEILCLLKAFGGPGELVLAGNSIEQDRRFIHKHMKELDQFLHYRHMNVSSFKEIITRWYPDSPYKDFTKKKNHLATDDILESIEEMKHYRRYFFSFEG